MSSIQIFYECDCGCSGVTVTEADWEERIYVSLWRINPNYYYTSWKQRLRYIRDILRYGHPHTDSVILTLERAREFGERLIELAGLTESDDE